MGVTSIGDGKFIYYDPMRIDAHQHFWELDRFTYAWMPPPPSCLRRNFLPEDLEPILAERRFDGTVLVQAHTHLDETRWFLELASQYAFIKGVVGWADLPGSNLGKALDEFQQHRKFKGIRHPVHDEADDEWLLRPNVLAGLKELARRGIPYDLLLRPQHLRLVPRVAEAVPDLRMVIDHIAKPLIAEHLMDGWARDMESAAAIPQVYCKISGMITEADHSWWSAEDLRPYVAHVLAVFGPDRLMFGSDWPVCLLAGSWKRVLAAFTQAVGPLPGPVRDKLLGDTARSFYKLQ
ncbi:MAG: amidohydrolase family protein [Acidobacteriota bacterium]|nr:amidohydrolase family protein [Acidobacteriota bacterium]